MVAATPLPPPDDFLDFGPIDEAYLAQLPPEIRATYESAEERIANGTARIIREEDVPAALDEIRRLNVG